VDLSIKTFLFVMLVGLASAAFLTYLIMWFGLRQGVLDVPNARSSHTSPVPRGGGLAIIVTFYVFLYVYSDFAALPFGDLSLASLMFGGAIIAAVGAWDDLHNIPAKWRFFAHLIAAVIALKLLPEFPAIDVFGRSFPLENIGIPVYAICLVWSANLFNFMDGIDGLAGSEAITALGCAALILFANGQSDWMLLLGFLSACIAGFLVWNWPPARIFMGDAGSGFLGFVLGILAIESSVSGAITLWTWAIVLGVFIVDATTTLIVRMTSGAKWYEAHRSHAYQILARRFESHRKVTVGVIVINLVWLFPLVYLASAYPHWGLLCCATAWAPLVVLALNVGAGRSESSAT
jgi:Fuc2NAc and GlcNAc transferase